MTLSVDYSYDKCGCAWRAKMDGPVTISLIEITLVSYAVQDSCTSATWADSRMKSMVDTHMT